jgi:hypothetical protein
MNGQTAWSPATFDEGAAAWRQDNTSRWQEQGVHLPGVLAYTPEGFKRDYRLAFDALPGNVSDPNSAVPMLLTTLIDPSVFRVLFAPMKIAEIMTEEKKGDWLMETSMFPIVEATGEVASYGDYADSGRAGVNTNWPNRQAYLFQVIKQYGERELERAGLARINWVTEIDRAAALSLNKFANYGYAFGLAGLQNYGLLNDPHLNPTIAPAPKAYGGTQWIVSGVIQATANEILLDIEALFYQLVTQTRGLVTREDTMILAMAPEVDVALTATNSFNVNVTDLVRKNFPNLKVMTATQYGAISSFNPYQGIAAGNLVQLIVPEIEGQKTGYCAYNEKLRAHPIIREMSAFRQKQSAGIWGTILRMTASIAGLLGV